MEGFYTTDVDPTETLEDFGFTNETAVLIEVQDEVREVTNNQLVVPLTRCRYFS